MAIRTTRLRGLLAASVGVAAITSASAAPALPIVFTVSPVESRITVRPTSSVTLDLGPLYMKSPVPFRGGFGIPATLPGGGVTDGLTTSLSGSVATDLATGASLRIVGRATELALGTSGNWVPAAPGAISPIEPADLGASFRFSSGSAALRDVTLSLSTPAASALVSTGPGAFMLEQDIDVALTSAVLDFLDPGFSAQGRVVLHDLHALLTSNATLLQTGPDTLELRIPLDASLHVPAAALHGVGFITSIDLDLTGQLVAHATVPIPEPNTLLLVATGLALVVLRRRPAVARAARHPLAWAVILAWPGLMGCPQFPAPLVDASDPDEEIVVEEMGTEGTDAELQWGPLTVTGTAAPAFPGGVIPILNVDAGVLGSAAVTVQSFGHLGNADARVDINWFPAIATPTAQIHVDSLQALQFSLGSMPSITMAVTAESSSKVIGVQGVRGTPGGQVTANVVVDCFDLADPAQPIVTQPILIGSPVPIVVPIFAPAGATATARCVFDLAVDGAPGQLGVPVKQSVSLLVKQLISGDVTRSCRTANDCFVNEACGIDDVCRPATEGSACQYADHCASPFPRCGPSALDPFGDGQCQDGSAGDPCFFDHDCSLGSLCTAGACVAPLNAPPAVAPIFAEFVPQDFTTYYDVFATDPEGDPLTYTWSGPDCGLYGTGAASPPETFNWFHPHISGDPTSCDPTTSHSHITVQVDVSDGTWTVRCLYQGAESGEGEVCFLL